MRSVRNKLLPALIALAVASPLVGALLGLRVGRSVWEKSRPGWLPIGSPPAHPASIAGIGLPEFAIEAPPTVYLRTADGLLWFYDASGSSADPWRTTSGDAAPPIPGWFDTPCDIGRFSFVPPPPGTIIDCAEYLPTAFQDYPEAYIRRYVLLDDGNVWLWARPDRLLSPTSLYSVWGLLAGAAVGLVFFRLFLRRTKDRGA